MYLKFNKTIDFGPIMRSGEDKIVFKLKGQYFYINSKIGAVNRD